MNGGSALACLRRPEERRQPAASQRDQQQVAPEVTHIGLIRFLRDWLFNHGNSGLGKDCQQLWTYQRDAVGYLVFGDLLGLSSLSSSAARHTLQWSIGVARGSHCVSRSDGWCVVSVVKKVKFEGQLMVGLLRLPGGEVGERASLSREPIHAL